MSIRTSDDICEDINACSLKLTASEKKCQDWKDTRRQFIQELKDNFPDIWLTEVKEKCEIGRAMAYRILQLPRPENADTSTDGSLQSRQTPSTEIGGETARMLFPSRRARRRCANFAFASLARRRKLQRESRPMQCCWSGLFSNSTTSIYNPLGLS
jgi:hypothetical protein